MRDGRRFVWHDRAGGARALGFELILLIGFAGVAALFHRRIATLEREVAEMRGLLLSRDARPQAPSREEISPTPDEPPVAPAHPPSPPRRAPARVVRAAAETAQPAPRLYEPAPVVPPPAPLPHQRPTDDRGAIEVLVGGKLPIWIGGAALVLAAFFLVRYSIESGLLGPGARVFLAALFSALLVGASEVARRAALTRDDPRVAQVLAGAGVASAYGTLYVAASQYQLIGAGAAFALMVAITAAALALALRHGPPTAIMALIGGFAAPLVAGFDAAGLGALLAYLALLIAALFGLAARRGWAWLAIAAVVAGFAWANLLIALLDGRDATGIAAFVVALAIGASLSLPATGAGRSWLRAAPLVAGFVQLLVLSPILEFGVVAWSFYLVLSVAALVLAWRDAAMLPAALAAAMLVVVLIGAALSGTGDMGASRIAATVAAALFGATGLALSRADGRWAAIGLVGLAGPALMAHALRTDDLPPIGWALVELLAAAGAAAMAWRHRDRANGNDMGLVGGSAVAALLAGIALTTLAGQPWASIALAPVVVALALCGRQVGDGRITGPFAALAFFALLLVGAETLAGFAAVVIKSLFGETLLYGDLPALAEVLRHAAVALAVGVALLARDPRLFGRARGPIAGITLALAVAVAYALAKQVLRIDTEPEFIARGFVERAAITLLWFAAGWALIRHGRFAAAGRALAATALFRFVWFDLVVLSPVAVAQDVGGIPLLNAAVILPAALAAGALTLPRPSPWGSLALVLTLVAVAAAVRQVAHGSILVGPLGNGENWGYSAAFLILALAWLARGLMTGSRQLRVAGLALLTVVTLKVFLIDVAALGGLLRILSFLGLGVALIGIGWAYGRIIGREKAPPPPVES